MQWEWFECWQLIKIDSRNVFNYAGGDALSDGFLSEESDEEEEFVGFFANDSDSDMSDSFLENEDLDAEASPGKLSPHKSSSHDSHNQPQVFHTGDANGNNNLTEWVSSVEPEKLAHFSSELFSQSSMSFLKNNFRQNNKSYEADVKEFEDCKDVIQGKKNVSVPPGL